MEIAKGSVCVGWNRVSGSHQGGMSSVYPVNADSYLVPACPCRPCSGRAQPRLNGDSRPVPHDLVSPHMSLALFEVLFLC